MWNSCLTSYLFSVITKLFLAMKILSNELWKQTYNCLLQRSLKQFKIGCLKVIRTDLSLAALKVIRRDFSLAALKVIRTKKEANKTSAYSAIKSQIWSTSHFKTFMLILIWKTSGKQDFTVIYRTLQPNSDFTVQNTQQRDLHWYWAVL